ncbi:MAG: twin-arginine translocation signal domain-containing protein [Planctomycetes bacterium]|nr:twin-arginine translocation signal domain-containing protein [Planctomycetota bacterium]
MQEPTRRRFLQAAAVGAALPLADAVAQDPPSADQALLGIVRQRFKFLSDAQLKAVQAGLQRSLASAEILKRTRLTQIDEPATIFVADLAE